MSKLNVTLSIEAMVAHGRTAISGLQRFGTELELGHLLAPLQAVHNKTVEATNLWLAAKANYKQVLARQRDASSGLYDQVKRSMRDFRNLLGEEWGPAWEGLGFFENSLEIPQKVPKLEELGRRMQVFLAADASRENAARGVTAERMLELITALNTARTDLAAAMQTVAMHSTTRKAQADELRRNLSALRELLKKVGPQSDLWYSFGFSRPADPPTPVAPANVRTETLSPGRILVSWDRGLRAERYKVFLKGPGDAAPTELKGRTRDLQMLVSGLTQGVSYTVTVVSVNSAGESAPTEPVTVIA